MKTIRLLYPDYVSGGLETYFFGANLLTHILPVNDKQPIIKVEIAPPDGTDKLITEGVYAKEEVLAGIRKAAGKIEAEAPDILPIIWKWLVLPLRSIFHLTSIGFTRCLQESIYLRNSKR